MDTNLKIARCKTKALTAVPFFGAPLLGIDVVEVDPVHPQTETMCTDGKRIYYNPDVVDEWSEPELLFVMLHEVAHILWGHHLRRGNRDPMRWNIACDYAVNPILVDEVEYTAKVDGVETTMHLTMPEGGLYDVQYRNMAAEKIYDLLPKDDDKLPEQQSWGAVMDATGDDGERLTEEQLDAAKAQVDVMFAQAIEAGKGVGNIPASAQEHYKRMLRPKVDWADKFHTTVKGGRELERSRSKVNRRQYYLHGGIEPSMRLTGVAPIVFAIDTSGSMSEKYLRQSISELNTLIEEVAPEQVTVIQCDYGVTDVQVFQSGDTVEGLNITGGGGTRIKPVFDYIDEHQIPCEQLVYLTDLDIGPEMGLAEPDYPVLFITYDKLHAPFGEVVSIN